MLESPMKEWKLLHPSQDCLTYNKLHGQFWVNGGNWSTWGKNSDQ